MTTHTKPRFIPALPHLVLSVLLLADFHAFAMAGTDHVASSGEPVAEMPGWPEGTLALVNDPLRTDGWNSWFSELPNDVNNYEYQIHDTDDVNRLLKLLAAIKTTNVVLRLNPNAQWHDVYRIGTKESNQTAVVLSVGDQKRLNQWYQHLREVEPGVRGLGLWRYTNAPVALPPTLTVYAGHPAINLRRLKVPANVQVIADIPKSGREDATAADLIKAIERIAAEHKPEPAKPGAKQP